MAFIRKMKIPNEHEYTYRKILNMSAFTFISKQNMRPVVMDARVDCGDVGPFFLLTSPVSSQVWLQRDGSSAPGRRSYYISMYTGTSSFDFTCSSCWDHIFMPNVHAHDGRNLTTERRVRTHSAMENLVILSTWLFHTSPWPFLRAQMVSAADEDLTQGSPRPSHTSEI